MSTSDENKELVDSLPPLPAKDTKGNVTIHPTLIAANTAVRKKGGKYNEAG